MKAKLKVLRGKLQTRRGESAGLEISVRSPRFVIGSSPECKLCCQSTTISPQHCELTTRHDELWVNDLGSVTGTYVNGIRARGTTRLSMGDRLQVGRLEFEVVIVADHENHVPRRDVMSDFVSELLDEVDELERSRRLADPSSRQFNSSQTDETSLVEDVASPKSPARPTKQPPKKLPPPPELVADDSVQAAEVTLNRILARLKGPKR